MFIINDKTLMEQLDTINLITLTYYSYKSDDLNIYDTNFNFNENIIPLITSVLETKPQITNVKHYSNIACESIITIDSLNRMPNKSQLVNPSFLHDLQPHQTNLTNNIKGYTKKLISSLDTDGDLLVRMYKIKDKIGVFSQNMLLEEEFKIIMWCWDYINVQIIINKEDPEQFQLQININITETNKIITSKMETINNIIVKVDKIKNFIFGWNTNYNTNYNSNMN